MTVIILPVGTNDAVTTVIMASPERSELGQQFYRTRLEELTERGKYSKFRDNNPIKKRNPEAISDSLFMDDPWR